MPSATTSPAFGLWTSILTVLIISGLCTNTSAQQSGYESRLAEFEHADSQASSSRASSDDVLDHIGELDRRLLLDQVLNRNPTIDAARQAWRSALARFPQSTSLDDPIFQASTAPASLGADTRFGYVVSISQRLPFPKKLSLRGTVTLAESDEARADYDLSKLHLALLGSHLFDEYFIYERGLDINAQHIKLLADLQNSVMAQYAAGRASQTNLLSAEVEIAHLDHQKLSLTTKRDVVVAQLNGLLHRSPDRRLPPPPEALRMPSSALALGPAEADADSPPRRPELRSLDAQIRRAEAAVALAERESYPDFQVMSSYNSMWGTSDHRWMVGASINLPIRLSRRRAAVTESKARLVQHESEALRLENDIAVEVEQARLHFIEALHVVALYKDRLVPASRDRVEAARAGFVAAQDSFLSVIEAEKDLRSVELEYAVAQARVYQRLADLDRAVGRMPGIPRTGGHR